MKLLKGLSYDTVRRISKIKNEPDWMLETRLRALRYFQKKSLPNWGVDLSSIDFQNITYYSSHDVGKQSNWKDVPEKILKTFDRLGIPQAERKFLAGVATQYESEVVYNKLKKRWNSLGVIYTDCDSGLREYPAIFKKYFGKIIPVNDNKFAALNTAVWSGGSFVYVPKGVKIDIPLQAYFWINAANLGQFERTLIIAEEGSSVHYVEGCFMKGAKVTTLYGEKNIEDVVIRDKVLTHKGIFKPVYKIMKRMYKGFIYKITYWGDSSSELNVTEDHPLLVAKRKSNEYRNIEFKKQWISAKNLEDDDYLVIPIKKTVKRDNFQVKIKIRKQNRQEFMRVDFPFKPEFFRLLGYYLSEGYIDNEHYISFSFRQEKTDYIKDVENLSKKYFQQIPVKNNHRQNGQILAVYSTKYARAFAKIFGATVYQKKIPFWIFNISNDCLSELIKGMWRGNGSFDRKRVSFRFSSISRSLAYGLRDILLKLGIIASINKQSRIPSGEGIYTVMISTQNNNLFGKLVDIQAKDGIMEWPYLALDEKYMYVRIKSIIKQKVNTKVYNFAVKDHESYVCEGVISHNCSAPKYSKQSLHSAIVEIFVAKNARVKYTTIQNWSTNVYNLTTQRGLVKENGSLIWVDANIGSKVTMKYPAIILAGERAYGEVMSANIAEGGQHQDTGAKVIHLVPNTSSLITSKSICKNGGKTTYRGLVKINKGAKNSKSKVRCDSLILDNKSEANTYPYNDVSEKQSQVEHEAYVSKIGKEQLIYLMSKGLSEGQSNALIASGFLEPVIKELPMEYAVELNALIDMSMEGGVG